MSLAKKVSDEVSEQEYLDGERISEVRHEYIDGGVYAMAGGTANHNRISQNISRKLGNALENKQSPCDVFSESMKVRESKNHDYFYPDVFVVCDQHPDDDPYYRHSPIILVEVLSDSTRITDKTTKKRAYFNIPTLQEYVIIEQQFCEVAVFSRNKNWKPDLYFLGDSICFESIGVTVSVEDIYYHVDNPEMALYLAQQEKPKQ